MYNMPYPVIIDMAQVHRDNAVEGRCNVSDNDTKAVKNHYKKVSL